MDLKQKGRTLTFTFGGDRCVVDGDDAQRTFEGLCDVREFIGGVPGLDDVRRDKLLGFCTEAILSLQKVKRLIDELAAALHSEGSC